MLLSVPRSHPGNYTTFTHYISFSSSWLWDFFQTHVVFDDSFEKYCCCSVAKSCLTFCNPMNRSTPSLPALHCLPKFAQIYIHWVGEDIQPFSSSVTPFSSCPQSFPASGSFPTNQLFASGGQSIEASASASVLPMIIQGWFPLEFTGLISLQSKGLSRVFSTTTAEKYQFFGAQPSLWSNSHICTWVLEKP